MNRHTSGARAESGDAQNVALWIAQGLLFTVFAVTGFLKLTQPVEQLAPMMSWISGVPVALVRCIGAVEVAGALGVLLPALTRVRTELTPLAAAVSFC